MISVLRVRNQKPYQLTFEGKKSNLDEIYKLRNSFITVQHLEVEWKWSVWRKIIDKSLIHFYFSSEN